MHCWKHKTKCYENGNGKGGLMTQVLGERMEHRRRECLGRCRSAWQTWLSYVVHSLSSGNAVDNYAKRKRNLVLSNIPYICHFLLSSQDVTYCHMRFIFWINLKQSLLRSLWGPPLPLSTVLTHGCSHQCNQYSVQTMNTCNGLGCLAGVNKSHL